MDNERRPLPKQWVLVLNEYEVVNLVAVLTDINEHSQRYNTGDWVNQIRWKLPHSSVGIGPNPFGVEAARKYANPDLIGMGIVAYQMKDYNPFTQDEWREIFDAALGVTEDE